MTSKERLMRALEGEPVDGFPVVLPYLDIFLRDHWHEVTHLPWWAIMSGDLDLRLQVVEELQQNLQIDWIQVGPCPTRRWREEHRVIAKGARTFIVDVETSKEQEIFEPPVGGEQVLVREAYVRTDEDVEKFIELIPADELISSGQLDFAKMVVERFGDTNFVVALVSTPFWGTYSCFGFYEMMTNLIERPSLVEHCLERLTDERIEWVKAYARVGVDGIFIEDCYASADLISLEHFLRFDLYYTKRVVEAIRKLGMKSIYYFCGDVSDRLEELVAMGPDAISLEESKKGFIIDLEEVDKVVSGRCCLFGNIDSISILQNGSHEQIRKEIERQVGIGARHRRFVVSLGSPVTPMTPLAKVKEFVRIAREVGKLVRDE